MALCCTSPTAIRRPRPWSGPASRATCCRGGTSCTRARSPTSRRMSCGACVPITWPRSGRRDGRGRGRVARARRAPGRARSTLRAGRPVVRARPLRPAPADPDPRAGCPTSPTRVELICIGTFPGRPDFPGLGELEPDELASLWPRAHARSHPSTCTSPRDAWDVVRGRDPRALARAAATPDERLPYLAPGARAPARGAARHPRRPWPHRAPAARGGGRRRARPRRRVPRARWASEEAPFMGDTIAFDRLGAPRGPRARQRRAQAHRRGRGGARRARPTASS